MKKKFDIVIPIILTGFFLILLYWRFQVSQTRFFDIDELSYLHWTSQMVRGDRLYVDLFSYVTPGFMWVNEPLFWLFGMSVQVFKAARMLSFAVFLGILTVLTILFGKTRSWRWALLPAVILAFLPMPYDKFLEIRPDNLATLLALLGILTQLRAMEGKKAVWWAVAGLLYGVSLLVLVKTFVIIAVGVGIALIVMFRKPHSFKILLLFGGSLALPWIVLFSEAALTGYLHETWYSLTTLVWEATRGAVNFIMEPNLFFNPNVAFYGGTGRSVTLGLLVNNIVWTVGVLVGTYRLITPFTSGTSKKALTEFFLSLVFVVSIFAYVKFFPMKHSQYLIPIAVFIAYYTADGLSVFLDKIRSIAGIVPVFFVLGGMMYIFGIVTRDINAPKLAQSNTAQLSQYVLLTELIPRNTRVVDLEGMMLFWQEGYPVCCVPFDMFLEYVTEGPEPLSVYLSKHPAEYIYQGDSNRITFLTPTNQAYIREHYEPVSGWGEKLWKRKR